MSTRMNKGFVRRASAAIAAVAVGGLLLSGCASNGGANPDGSVTLTVMGQENEMSAEQIAAFEKENPKIKVEFIEYDVSRLNAMLTAGESLDYVRSAPSVNTFAKGLALDLTDYIAKSDVIKEDDLLPVNDNWRWDGKKAGSGPRYGVVKDWSPDASIWINKAVFAQAGVDVPSLTEPLKWDELLDVAEKLKAGGVEHPLGVEWQWGIASKIETMIRQQGKTLYNEDLTKIDFTSPEAKRAFQWFVDYAKADVGPSVLNPLADGSDLATFAAGKMAATMDGYWFGGNFASKESADIQPHLAMLPGPTFDERVNPSFNGGIGGWIPSSSKHKDEAWKFFEYYLGGQPAVERAKSGWGLPSLDSLIANLPADLPYQKQATEAVQAELPYSQGAPATPYLSGAQLEDAINLEITSVLKDGKSVDDALRAVEEQVNDALAKGKDQIG